MVLYYQINSKQNNSNNKTACIICWHIIIRPETWVDGRIAPEPAIAFLLIGVGKVTAGIELKQGLVNKFCENIPKWRLHQDKLWTFTYSAGLEIWELFETIFLEDFNFASSPEFKNMLTSLKKGYLKYNRKHFTSLLYLDIWGFFLFAELSTNELEHHYYWDIIISLPLNTSSCIS